MPAPAPSVSPSPPSAWPGPTAPPPSTTSTSWSAPAGPAWSAPTAPASPPCSGWPPASSARPRARCRWPARSATCRRTSPSTVAQRVDGRSSASPALRALRAVEAGGRPGDFDAIGDDWDVEERAVAELARLGLPAGPRPPDRRAVRRRGHPARRWPGCCWAGPTCCCSTSRPTTSTPRRGSGSTTSSSSGRGTLLVVSHDRELLERVDRIGDLRDGAVRWYGGGFSAYADQVAAEQEAAEQAVTAARSDLRRQQADRVEAERVLAQRKRQGARKQLRASMGKAVTGRTRSGRREVGGGLPQVHEERLERRRSGSTRPRPGCARTARSGSTCRTPRCTAASSC